MTGILARLPRPRRLALLLGGSALAAVAYFGLGGERVEVLPGLPAGVRVVESGAGFLADGDAVKVAAQ
jgi:HlyD family secretion protein